MAHPGVAQIRRFGIPVGGAVIASLVGVLMAQDRRATPAAAAPELAVAEVGAPAPADAAAALS
ncbi:MAG TPA: hypothetical protein VF796_21020, partial [Humisphaera sp.]